MIAFNFRNFNPKSCDFIDAAALSTDALRIAIDYLTKELINKDLYTKMTAVYPIIGGGATSHKFNLIDPRDLDAAYRLAFAGTITHSSTGMLSNGSTGYGNTYIIPRTNLSQNSVHISFYSRTNNAGGFEAGSYTNSSTDRLQLISKFSDNNQYAAVNSAGVDSVAAARGDGFVIINRTASNVINAWRNTTKTINTARASVNPSPYSIFLLGLSSTGALFQPSIKECAFASIGSGLTDTNVSDLYTIVQAYQTLLGRQV